MVGAVSLGALISGDIAHAESYHLSLLYHLGDIRSLTDEMVVPSLALAALYWQHRGEDDRKSEWVGHARRVLANVQVRVLVSVAVVHVSEVVVVLVFRTLCCRLDTWDLPVVATPFDRCDVAGDLL